MSSLLTRTGYEPIPIESIEAAKDEVAKLPPGAVVVTAMKFRQVDIPVSPLREVTEDIESLSDYFLTLMPIKQNRIKNGSMFLRQKPSNFISGPAT